MRTLLVCLLATLVSAPALGEYEMRTPSNIAPPKIVGAWRLVRISTVYGWPQWQVSFALVSMQQGCTGGPTLSEKVEKCCVRGENECIELHVNCLNDRCNSSDGVSVAQSSEQLVHNLSRRDCKKPKASCVRQAAKFLENNGFLTGGAFAPEVDPTPVS